MAHKPFTAEELGPVRTRPRARRSRRLILVKPYTTPHGVFGWMWVCQACSARQAPNARGYCRDNRFLVRDYGPARIRALNRGMFHAIVRHMAPGS